MNYDKKETSLMYEEMRSAEKNLNDSYGYISKLTVQLYEKEKALRVMEQKNEKQERKIEYLRAVIKKMKSSKSWRLTLPIRKISKLIKHNS